MSFLIWCQGGPANNWRYETSIEPDAVIYVAPGVGAFDFIRVLEGWEGATTYVRQPHVEQFGFERIYYPKELVE